jgi:hypothetical protein
LSGDGQSVHSPVIRGRRVDKSVQGVVQVRRLGQDGMPVSRPSPVTDVSPASVARSGAVLNAQDSRSAAHGLGDVGSASDWCPLRRAK